MSSSFKVRAEAFNSTMQRYITELGYSAPEVFQRQMRLFLKEVQNIAYPRTKGEGERAVEKDIHKAVTPLDRNTWRNIKDKRLRKRLQEATQDKKDYTALRAILKNIGIRKMEVVQFSETLHTSVRNRRGQVRYRTNKFTADVEAWKSYVTKVKSRVGWARSGWNAGAKMLGAAVAQWFGRHGTSGGTAVGHPSHKENPFITMTNTAWEDPRAEDLVRTAAAIREKKMTIDLEQRLKRGAIGSGFKS